MHRYDQSMIISELTDLTQNVVAVNPREFSFGAGCIVCGSSECKPTSIRFRSVMIIGAAGGLEAITLELPLCDKHAQAMQQGESRIASILAMIFFSGLGLVCVAFYLMRSHSPKSDSIAGVCALIGALLMLGSMIGMLTTKAHLPINLVPRTHGKFSTGEYGAFVFAFPDSASAKRFFDTNNKQ
jgi:hypothetical protein